MKIEVLQQQQQQQQQKQQQQQHEQHQHNSCYYPLLQNVRLKMKNSIM